MRKHFSIILVLLMVLVLVQPFESYADELYGTIDDELFDVYSYITELFPDAVITEPSGEKGRLVSSINLNDKTIVDTYTLEKSNGEKYSLDVFNDGSCVLLEIKPTPNLRGFSITNSGSSYTIKWTYFSVTLYSTAYLFLNRLYSASYGYYFQTITYNNGNATNVTMVSVTGSGSPCRRGIFHGNVQTRIEGDIIIDAFGLELNGYVSGSTGDVTGDYNYGPCY